MKLRRVRIENVRSFLAPAELLIDGDISIIIGPNGGGKTNLLDITTTALRRHLLTSWVSRKSATLEHPDRYEFVVNDAFNSVVLEPHSKGVGRQKVIEIELEVTKHDMSNMAGIHASATRLADYADRKYVGAPIREAADWDLSSLAVGQRFTYRIINDALQEPQLAPERLYRRYLALYEADSRLRDELGDAPLSTPMVSMPVNRSAGNFPTSVSLASHNEFDFKKSVDAATSRVAGSIVTLAVGRIARRFRLLLEKDKGSAHDEFYADPRMQSLSSVLDSLGYRWELVSVDPLTNQYDIQLEKEGSSFLVAAASSGEKELLTYLFAIYALNVRDALIVVDEPELHLHPRWQSILLGLFERLSGETGNQFLLATHSPVFVSPASIQYVSRVFSREQQSDIVRLKSDTLPEAKHLFSIVNSQNNERMFFADKVILVEGITDRLFFDSLFRRLGLDYRSIRTYEVVSVGGKGFFGPYEALLRACRVTYAVIADLDYINEVGTPDVKALFAVNEAEIVGDVVNNPKSTDGDALVSRLEEAITTGKLDDLRALWEYIKRRRRRLRGDLGTEERHLVDEFIRTMRQKAVFILAKGDLETYLPQGYRSKDLDKLIRLVEGDFWPQLPDFAQTELALIADEIKKL